MIKTFIIFGMMCFAEPDNLSEANQKCFNILDVPFIYHKGIDNCRNALQKKRDVIRETYAKNGLTITQGYIYCLEVNPNVNT